MAATRLVRVDDASYEAIASFRSELERRRQKPVTMGRALRELLVQTAKRIMAEDHRGDRPLRSQGHRDGPVTP